MQKNILIISAVFPPEPVVSAQLSMDIAKDLSTSQRVIVLRPYPTRPLGFSFGKYEALKNINIITVSSYVNPQSNIVGRIRESISFGHQCSKYIKTNHDKFDCIYMSAWPLFAQHMIAKEAHKYNIPYITHIQDIYPESYMNKIPSIFRRIVFKFLMPIDRYSLRKAKSIIVISDNMKAHLMKTRNIEKDKMVVVPNWQDESEFVNYQKLHPYKENDVFTFMYLGNIGPVAGVDLLINSFVKAQIVNSRLKIAGSGSMKEKLQEKVQTLGQIHIEFWDVPSGKVPETQSLADVMLLPVKKGAAMSSIPSKLPAYMFSSKPIIGCLDDNSDTSRAIIDSKCGWTCEPENEDSLIKCMTLASSASNEELREKGKCGFDYAIKHFSKNRNLGKVVNLINSINNDNCIKS